MRNAHVAETQEQDQPYATDIAPVVGIQGNSNSMCLTASTTYDTSISLMVVQTLF